MATTIAIWNDIYITCGGSTLSLMSTDLKCRVALQSAMMVDADDLIDNLKSNGLTLRIENHGLHVELGDKEVELKTVLQLIGGFLDRYYVRESTKNDRLIFHDPATSTSWKVTKKTSAQSPVDDSRVECRADNVKRKHKSGLAKWLIPIGIGVTTAIAAPIVIPAAVGALGFGAGGIVGGSLAASMMSAAAVANGGGVAAGGLIATLQSIGAVGAISASTAVTAGVAAGGASGAVVAVASKLSKDEDE